MESAARFSAVPIVGEPRPELVEEAKLTRQFRVLRQHFGFGSLVGVLSFILSLITIVLMIGTPVYKRGETDGASAKALSNLEETQKQTKEEFSRALSDAVIRIEAGVKQAIDLAQQNREDVKSMRESSERQLVELRQQVLAAWTQQGKLESRISRIEMKQEAHETK